MSEGTPSGSGQTGSAVCLLYSRSPLVSTIGQQYTDACLTASTVYLVS